MATKGKPSTVKRKTKRFTEGGETQFSPEQEKWLGGADRTDPYILARMRRDVPDQAPVRDSVPAKPSAQIEMESSIQNALKNKQSDELSAVQDTQTSPTPARVVKPKRSAAVDELSSVAKNRADAYKKADAEARTPEARAERQKQIEGQAIERVTPETNFLPGASIKTLANVAKGMAARHAAKGVEKLAEYSTPILEMAKRRIGMEPLKLGMKKGGAVKKVSKPTVSSASRRADGIVSKGKTKGRMV